MSRKFLACALLVLAVSCGGSGSGLRNIDDACSIARQKPDYLRAMERTEDRWGIPVAVQMATIWQESKFVGDARTPVRYEVGVIPMGRQSSAYGYAQAIDSTWDEYRQQSGNRSARRDRFRDAVDFIGWYMDESTRKLGISRSDARRQYLAYHEGRGGYARGSYNGKSWLLAIARDVERRAANYDRQLQSCGRA